MNKIYVLFIKRFPKEDGNYVSGNVVFCINKVNTCKNDLSLEEIEKWMPSWYERIIRNFRCHSTFISKGE